MQKTFTPQKAPSEKIKNMRTYLKTDSCEYLIEEKVYDRSGYLIKRDSFAIFHGHELPFEQETFRYYGINRDSIVYNSKQEDEEKVTYSEITLKLNSKGQIVSTSGNKRYDKKIKSRPYNDSYTISSIQYNEQGHLSRVVSQDQDSPMSKKDILLNKKDTTFYFNVYDTIGFDHYQYTKHKGSGRGYNYNNQGLVDSVTQMKVYRHIPNKDAVIVFDSTEFVTAYTYQNGKVVSVSTEFKDQEMASKHQRWFKRHLILSEIANGINIEETEYVLEDGYVTSKIIYHEQIMFDKKKRVSAKQITVLRNGNQVQNELIMKYKKYWF